MKLNKVKEQFRNLAKQNSTSAVAAERLGALEENSKGQARKNKGQRENGSHCLEPDGKGGCGLPTPGALGTREEKGPCETWPSQCPLTTSRVDAASVQGLRASGQRKQGIRNRARSASEASEASSPRPGRGPQFENHCCSCIPGLHMRTRRRAAQPPAHGQVPPAD